MTMQLANISNKPELSLCIPVPVSVNKYLQPKGKLTYIGKKPVATVHMFQSKESREYKEVLKHIVRREVINQNWQVPVDKTQHFYIEVDIFFATTARDANNIWKIMLDAITDTKKIWDDDTQCCERVNSIRYDAAFPRVQVTIRPVEYIGVFDTQSELDEFSKRCNECSRGKTNCSIKRRCIEGRIIEEVADKYCLKFKEKKS